MERIDKLLSATGRWSRKEVKELVRQGRVLAGGRVVLRPEEKGDPAALCLTVDGVPVDCSPFVYVMLNKPEGVLSATEDGQQPTVLDLLPPELRQRGLFPVGRLDKDTTGLLLLTDDGDLAHRLLSPRKHVDKVYLARVDGVVVSEDIEALAAGLTLADGTRCLPAGLKPLADGRSCLVTLREGKYHQVKRMLAARGKPVRALHRLSMGPLTLDGELKPGKWRFLTLQERTELQRLDCAT
ncbi:MAG: rRNA pseudouridine synthase [Lawsonibacter sp.]|jgi:16S rRNA pseudouridine516 synthase|nr:rRNA pseudouridine synthase [Lawsonibacter sp.]